MIGAFFLSYNSITQKKSDVTWQELNSSIHQSQCRCFHWAAAVVAAIVAPAVAEVVAAVAAVVAAVAAVVAAAVAQSHSGEQKSFFLHHRLSIFLSISYLNLDHNFSIRDPSSLTLTIFYIAFIFKFLSSYFITYFKCLALSFPSSSFFFCLYYLFSALLFCFFSIFFLSKVDTMLFDSTRRIVVTSAQL